MPADQTPSWQGSRITVEEIPPAEMQHLAEPGLPMRLVVSGVVHDPTGAHPPRQLELRLSWAMLADLKSQIHAFQMSRFAEGRRRAMPPPEPPPEVAVVQSMSARREPGAWLAATLTPEQIAERHDTWTPPGATAAVHAGLLRQLQVPA
ncbi:hypothetical protein [Kitasatospora aureofaciens]|uniref:hypothetical protein n=1 Tax=Kitasatospora aureofaciens TaxID=1894 RepID=UPI0036F4AE8A